MRFKVRIPKISIPLLSRLSVTFKISAGIAVVLLIVAANSGMALMGFGAAEHGVNQFTASVKSVGYARDLERQFLNYMATVEAYAVSGNFLKLTNAKREGKRLVDDTKSVVDTTSGNEQEQFGQLHSQFEKYTQKFDAYAKLRMQQTNLKKSNIDPAIADIRKELDALIETAQFSGIPDLANKANGLSQTLIQLALSLERLYGEYNPLDRDAVLSSSKTAMSRYDALKGTGGLAMATSAKIEAVGSKLTELDQSLNTAIKAIEGSNSIRKNDMFSLASSSRNMVQSMREKGVGEQHGIEESMIATIKSATKMNLIAAMAGIAIGALLALVIGRGLSRPIVAMCAAMRQLAQGNFEVVLPGLGRGDEIGQMASAVEDFKSAAIARAESDATDRELKNHEAELARKGELVRFADRFETSVGAIVDSVSSSATQLQEAAGSLRSTAETTQSLSSMVASASEETSANVQSVASATEELTASVAEIGRQVEESRTIAQDAVSQVERTNSSIRELSESAIRIGDVVKLITAIAEQTNLLALNATIEAARAGEAGRGFAVVAQEVKALANQTAKATDEISAQISAMQAVTQDSVDSIGSITSTIEKISAISQTISESVRQQSEATHEIAENVQNVAQGAVEVGSNISDVNRGAADTGTSSQQVLDAAQHLADNGARLKAEVEQFLESVRAA